MRNIFDQYSQPENRLTHALASVLHHDRGLLKDFLKKFGPVTHPPVENLHVIEQGLPGSTESEEEKPIKQGLPDAIIFDEQGWAFLVESKISSALTKDQLQRHINTVRKCGYDQIHGLTITMNGHSVSEPEWYTTKWKWPA